MTRKATIQSAVGCIGIGIVTLAFWPRENQGVLTVIHVGISTNDTNLVSFNITNKSTNTLAYDYYGQVDHRGLFFKPGEALFPQGKPLPPLSAVTVDYRLATQRPWRVVVAYWGTRQPSALWRLRRRSAAFLIQHNWGTVGRWINAKPYEFLTYGPNMLGNTPEANDHRKSSF